MITFNIFYLNSELTAYLHNQNLAQADPTWLAWLPNLSQYGQLSSQPEPNKETQLGLEAELAKAQAMAFRAGATLGQLNRIGRMLTW